MSVSTKNALGTFNWTNPNRSSAKIAGIQRRGKKAANLELIDTYADRAHPMFEDRQKDSCDHNHTLS